MCALGFRFYIRDPKSTEAEAFCRDIPTLLALLLRGFIWDISILIFAYVLFWGPTLGFVGSNGAGFGLRFSVSHLP